MAKSDKAVKEKEEQLVSEERAVAGQNGNQQADSKKQVQAVEFAEAPETEPAGSAGSIDILLDMEVPVTVAIGQTEVPIRQLLQFGPGSVLKLGKPIDEPVDLYLRDTKFAAGSVVVVDGRFAVKIKQIFNVSDSVAGADNGEKKS